MALTAVGPCEDNPCDPTCQSWDETPNVPVVANTQQGTTTIDWSAGTISDLPPGLVHQALIEPCKWGADCQFNYHCTNVATDTSCPHSKCATGDAFTGTCAQSDPCVKAICAKDPACCTSSCVHDPCVTGAKLASTCDACVASVCAVRSECCGKSWTQECVDLIATRCGGATCECAGGDTAYEGHCYRYFGASSKADWRDAQDTCAGIGGGWNLVTIGSSGENDFAQARIGNNVDQMWIGLNDRAKEGVFEWSSGEAVAYTNWDANEPVGSKSDDCVMLRGTTDKWAETSCYDKKPFLCEGTGTVLSTGSGVRQWDQGCVDLIPTVCDAECGVGSPLPQDGTCVPWLPGQTDPTCSGIDLSLGVPCDNLVPVCNHGNLEAPAGIPMIHYPGNSPQYGVCDPVAQSNMVECSTTEPIPPGHCINVDCDLWSVGIGSNRQIYINPPGYDGYVTECSCLDNWTEAHQGNACGPAECSGTVSQGSIKPVNMYFMVDKSGSMGSCTGSSKWTATRNALKSFFESPDSAGLRIALEFFRLNADQAQSGDDGCGPSCDTAPCANPLVPLGTLTDQPRPADTHEQDLVYWIQQICPGGMTPAYPALDGALTWSVNHQLSTPDEAHVVVFVTDGQPTECELSNSMIANLALEAFSQYGVRTYPIGMDGADYTALDAIAQKGGTGQAIRIDASDPANVEAELLAALTAIAGQALSCNIELPDVSLFNPNDAQVIFTDSSGNQTTLGQASTEGACDATHNWYYDDNAAPTQIVLCPDTCATAQADPAGRVEVHLGCPVTYEPTSVTQLYEGSCPPGTHVQWGYLAYDTSTPGDSRVEFGVRTADSAALLAGDVQPVATAQASPDTQVCPMTGVAGCPVDLFTALGAPDVFGSVLELNVTLIPSTAATSTPTVNNWQLTYSCPPTE